jgi:hypothetical protein
MMKMCQENRVKGAESYVHLHQSLCRAATDIEQ